MQWVPPWEVESIQHNLLDLKTTLKSQSTYCSIRVTHKSSIKCLLCKDVHTASKIKKQNQRRCFQRIKHMLGHVNLSWSHLLQRRCVPGAHLHPQLPCEMQYLHKEPRVWKLPKPRPKFPNPTAWCTQVQRYEFSGNCWQGSPGLGTWTLVAVSPGCMLHRWAEGKPPGTEIQQQKSQKMRNPSSTLKNKTRNLKENVIEKQSALTVI